MAEEQVVAQHQGARLVGDELAVEQKGLGDARRLRLLDVFQAQAPLTAVAQQTLEQGRVMRRGNDEDFPDTGQHQAGQRVIDHRLVVDRQQLLRHGNGQRVKPGAGTAGQDDAFHDDFFVKWEPLPNG